MERQREIQVHRVELDEVTTIHDRKKNRINQKIKSIILSRSSNPNVSIFCRTVEGDEFFLTPGRVMNFSTPTQGIVFSWDSHPFEWAEFEYSENEHLSSFTPQQATSVASNIATKVESKFVPMMIFGYGNSQTKLVDSNPNRIKLEIENLTYSRIFIGSYENTTDVGNYNETKEYCRSILPHNKIEISTQEEIWAIDDGNFKSVSQSGPNPNALKIKVTEYIK